MPGPFDGSRLPPNAGWIAKKFDDLQRQITELRAARTWTAPPVAGWSEQITNLNFTSTWTSYPGTQMIQIPAGMTYATLFLNVEAGEELTGGSGNLSVQAQLNYFDHAGSPLGTGSGTSFNSGQSTIPVAQAFSAAQGALVSGATQLQMAVSVADSIGSSTRVANSGNWAGGGFIIFGTGPSY